MAWYHVCNDYTLELIGEKIDSHKYLFGLTKMEACGGVVYFDTLDEGPLFYKGDSDLDGLTLPWED